jgi:hypothetical protein
MVQTYPQLGRVGIAHRWTGLVCITPDFLPHYHRPAEGVHVVVGFNGRGVALSVHAGVFSGRQTKLACRGCPVLKPPGSAPRCSRKFPQFGCDGRSDERVMQSAFGEVTEERSDIRPFYTALVPAANQTAPVDDLGKLLLRFDRQAESMAGIKELYAVQPVCIAQSAFRFELGKKLGHTGGVFFLQILALSPEGGADAIANGRDPGAGGSVEREYQLPLRSRHGDVELAGGPVLFLLRRVPRRKDRIRALDDDQRVELVTLGLLEVAKDQRVGTGVVIAVEGRDAALSCISRDVSRREAGKGDANRARVLAEARIGGA